MTTVDKIIQSATFFYNELKNDKNGRYRSWEYCYKQFHDVRLNETLTNKDYLDYLSLHLAFYLASWGMYRGSSFLLQKDYKVHIPIIKIILNKKYDSLFGINCSDLKNKENMNKLMGLVNEIREYYDTIRKGVIEIDLKTELSNTLITKILMGTLGCVPAYDRYFIEGVKTEKVTTGNFNEKSLNKLIDFYEQNFEILESYRKKMKAEDLPYPQMKLLDMGFWLIGFENDTNKGLKIVH